MDRSIKCRLIVASRPLVNERVVWRGKQIHTIAIEAGRVKSAIVESKALE